MFTGIITNLGKLNNKKGSVFTFSSTRKLCKKINKGTSIAVNGACLTVVKKTSDAFSVEMMPETLRKTALGKLSINDLVNLELPLTTNDFLSGHIVQGHIDGVGIIKDIKIKGNSHILTIKISEKLSKYTFEKGSIAINGVSLTIISAGKTHFNVGIIPYTWSQTMLKNLKLRDLVNIEVDILAKYLQKLVK